MTRKWKPLAMCAEMALAYRQGRKTATRRLMSPQPEGLLTTIVPGHRYYDNGPGRIIIPPYKPGDGLWLREPIRRAIPDSRPAFHPGYVEYTADGVQAPDDFPWKWQPSALAGRYMPKILCRTLGICESVRTERVQDITVGDAMAEGITPSRKHTTWVQGEHPGHLVGISSWILDYADLWNSLHGKKPGERFEDNPPVLVYCLSKPLTTDHADAQRMLAEGETA